MLSGGASRVDGLREALHERFGAPVDDFDPFRSVAWNGSKSAVAHEDATATGAVAVGLALRKVRDR
jgi:Tfp pilus assembly PilM family ATPase